MILLDTSGLLAALDPDQEHHEAAATSLAAAQPPLLLSPFVLAELEYLVRRDAGQRAQLELLEEVAAHVYELESFGPADVDEARAIVSDYRDLRVSLADASVVVLARRFNIRDVLTLDQRHFRVLPSPRGPFRILPADA